MIDFCVTIKSIPVKGAEHLKITDLLVFLFFESLFKFNDLSSVNIHVIEKGVAPNILHYIREKQKNSPVPFEIYSLPEHHLSEVSPRREKVFTVEHDTAYTCEWMVENCGKEDFMIISHFDIGFRADFLKYIKGVLKPEHGIIGDGWKGIVLLNRIAYRQCNVGFGSMTYFFAVPWPLPPYKYKIRHYADPRCTDTSNPILGFDVMELLELNVAWLGWGFDPLGDKIFRQYFEHIRCGSWNTNPEISMIQHSRILAMLNEIGIENVGI